MSQRELLFGIIAIAIAIVAQIFFVSVFFFPYHIRLTYADFPTLFVTSALIFAISSLFIIKFLLTKRLAVSAVILIGMVLWYPIQLYFFYEALAVPWDIDVWDTYHFLYSFSQGLTMLYAITLIIFAHRVFWLRINGMLTLFCALGLLLTSEFYDTNASLMNQLNFYLAYIGTLVPTSLIMAFIVEGRKDEKNTEILDD